MSPIRRESLVEKSEKVRQQQKNQEQHILQLKFFEEFISETPNYAEIFDYAEINGSSRSNMFKMIEDCIDDDSENDLVDRTE